MKTQFKRNCWPNGERDTNIVFEAVSIGFAAGSKSVIVCVNDEQLRELYDVVGRALARSAAPELRVVRAEKKAA